MITSEREHRYPSLERLHCVSSTNSVGLESNNRVED